MDLVLIKGREGSSDPVASVSEVTPVNCLVFSFECGPRDRTNQLSNLVPPAPELFEENLGLHLQSYGKQW